MTPYAILFAAVVQFVLGALWYSPLLFGNQWMRIMGADTLSKEELHKMQKSMVPFYALQFVLTILFTSILAFDLYFARFIPLSLTSYGIAGGIWLGFIVPTQIGGVIWGSTPKRFWLRQCLIMVSYQFIGIMLATLVLTH